MYSSPAEILILLAAILLVLLWMILFKDDHAGYALLPDKSHYSFVITKLFFLRKINFSNYVIIISVHLKINLRKGNILAKYFYTVYDLINNI